mgnify:CR=1 FL=1
MALWYDWTGSNSNQSVKRTFFCSIGHKIYKIIVIILFGNHSIFMFYTMRYFILFLLDYNHFYSNVGRSRVLCVLILPPHCNKINNHISISSISMCCLRSCLLWIITSSGSRIHSYLLSENLLICMLCMCIGKLVQCEWWSPIPISSSAFSIAITAVYIHNYLRNSIITISSLQNYIVCIGFGVAPDVAEWTFTC